MAIHLIEFGLPRKPFFEWRRVSSSLGTRMKRRHLKPIRSVIDLACLAGSRLHPLRMPIPVRASQIRVHGNTFCLLRIRAAETHEARQSESSDDRAGNSADPTEMFVVQLFPKQAHSAA